MLSANYGMQIAGMIFQTHSNPNSSFPAQHKP
ncbi:DUF6783 domain-containing protein [Anaerobutyricum hallii]